MGWLAYTKVQKTQAYVQLLIPVDAKMGDEVNQIELCGENRNSGDHSNEAWKEGQHGVGEDEGGDGDSLYINGAGANCNCRKYLYGASLQSVYLHVQLYWLPSSWYQSP